MCDLTDVPGTAAWWQKLRTVTVRSSKSSREPSRKQVGLELVTEDICVNEVLSWTWEEDQRLLTLWSMVSGYLVTKVAQDHQPPRGLGLGQALCFLGRELLSFVEQGEEETRLCGLCVPPSTFFHWKTRPDEC